MSVINLVNQSNLLLIIVLDLDVLDCLFDGFLCKHGAVQFDRRKLKVSSDVRILHTIIRYYHRNKIAYL